MNHLAIVRILSILGIWLSGLFVFCAFLAGAIGETSEAIVFFVSATLCGPIGATILLLTDRPTKRTRAVDGLAVAVLFWAVTPLFCAIPFLPLVGESGYLGAYYESTSCLTTTGHSLIDVVATPLPTSILVWRALLHILGAIASITIAATVLSALNLGGPGIHRSRFFTIPQGSFFDSIPRVIRVSTSIIVAASMIIGGCLLATGSVPREALSGAVSAVTTGLVDPLSFDQQPSQGSLQVTLLSIGLLVGTLGLVVLDNVGEGKVSRAIIDPEFLALAGTLVAITLLAFMAGIPLLQAAGWSLSSVSTSGMALSDPARFDRLPLVLVLFPVLIGGSALSAAGGIKLARLVVLSKRVALEFSQLGYRGSVQSFTFRGKRQSEKTVMGVWVYLVGYIMASVAGILILSLSGLSFDDSILAAIGALSNSGHLIGSMLDPLSAYAQIGVILGMILGRLEVIALIPVLKPSFWRP
ncbi:MAG: potassium transporter TrkG [Henriciella sp.]|nr:potassium transporter TrkG [Henriciella sp.]